MTYQKKFPFLITVCFSLIFSQQVLAGNIDPDNVDDQLAWGENVGWINFDPLYGPGVTVTDTQLNGFAWGENIGWINFNPIFGGVFNDGNGHLSGYAWSENAGWINFNPTFGGVSINACGEFNGEAWGENIGWIRFRSDGANPFKVTTSWTSPLDDIAPVTTTSDPIMDWYNSDPTLTLNSTDCGSGTQEVHYIVNGNPEAIVPGDTANVTITGEGVYSFSFYSIDNDGNVESQNNVTVRIDKTPPVVDLRTPVDSASYFINTNVAADYSVSDSLSGIANLAATASDGAPINTSSTGSHSFYVNATDFAGNSQLVTHYYTIIYPGNIDTNNLGEQYAWAENVGWINFKPSYGPGVTVSDSAISGYAWGENIGWINFSPTSGGVVNDGQGHLSGYAWSENAGWINFNPQHGGVQIDPDTGVFSGYAWGENIGWISFSASGAVNFLVSTSWRPTPGQTIFDLTARAKDSKISLVWSPVANAQSYQIYRATTQGGPYNLIASGYVSDYATYLDSGLTNGVTYYYVVTSIINGKESTYSNEASATPTARTRTR